MSAFLKAPFGELALYLADFGYTPMPVKPLFKAPMLPDWQAGYPVDHWLPRCASWGTGILCASCPAIDIDVCDLHLVKTLVRLADDILGGSPIRVGCPPKVLLPFSTAAPFAKLVSGGFARPGEDWTYPSYKANRIEVLASGQQFVAYAEHPGTRRSYRWARGEPMQVQRIDLPELDHAGAARFIAAAERVLRAAGLVELERVDGRWRPIGRPPEQPPARTPRCGSSRSSWATMPADEAARIVDPKAQQTGRGWLVRCPAHQDDRPSLSLRDGDRGLAWKCFSGCSARDVARALDRVLA
jgi:hypothetical protein